MRNTLVLAILVSFSFAAQAANNPAPAKSLPKKAAKAPASTQNTAAIVAPETVNTEKTKAVTVTSISQGVLSKLSVGALISQADTLKGATYVANNGSVKGDADINSNTSMGLTAQYADQLPWANTNWFAGLTMEQSRELSSVKVGGLGTATIGQKPNFRPFIAHGGASYSFNSMIYAMGALNYTVYSEKSSGEFRSVEYYPELGLQYGVGIKLQRASIELMQKEVNYNLSANYNNNIKIEGRSTLAGLIIQGRYNF
jgi:hypothetical protein